MAEYYSDNFSTDESGNIDFRGVPAEKTHARSRKKRMFREVLIAEGTASDVIIMGTFKSGDRLYDLKLSTGSASPTTGTINLGLHSAGLDHIPSASNVLDPDLFANGLAVVTELDETDALTQSGSVEHWRKGLTLWEMMNLTDGTYTADPMEDWDLVIDFTVALDADQQFLIVADFVSFG